MKTVLILAALLLCSTLQAQSPHKPIHKPKPAAPAPAPEPPAKPEISKEFAVLGRKAFSRIDRLNEQVLEIKTPRERGDLEEMSPEPSTWSLRAVEAETAADDLQAAAQTKLEKDIAGVVDYALYEVQSAHALYESQNEIDMHARNTTTLGLSVGVYTPPSKFDNKKAMDQATSSTEKVMTSGCIPPTRQALDVDEITPVMRVNISGCGSIGAMLRARRAGHPEP